MPPPENATVFCLLQHPPRVPESIHTCPVATRRSSKDNPGQGCRWPPIHNLLHIRNTCPVHFHLRIFTYWVIGL